MKIKTVKKQVKTPNTGIDRFLTEDKLQAKAVEWGGLECHLIKQ